MPYVYPWFSELLCTYYISEFKHLAEKLEEKREYKFNISTYPYISIYSSGSVIKCMCRVFVVNFKERSVLNIPGIKESAMTTDESSFIYFVAWMFQVTNKHSRSAVNL